MLRKLARFFSRKNSDVALDITLSGEHAWLVHANIHVDGDLRFNTRINLNTSGSYVSGKYLPIDVLLNGGFASIRSASSAGRSVIIDIVSSDGSRHTLPPLDFGPDANTFLLERRNGIRLSLDYGSAAPNRAAPNSVGRAGRRPALPSGSSSTATSPRSRTGGAKTTTRPVSQGASRGYPGAHERHSFEEGGEGDTGPDEALMLAEIILLNDQQAQDQMYAGDAQQALSPPPQFDTFMASEMGQPREQPPIPAPQVISDENQISALPQMTDVTLPYNDPAQSDGGYSSSVSDGAYE